MNSIFENILILGWQAGLLSLAVILVRYFLLNKIPKWSLCILWLLVGIRLIFPFSIRSSASVMTDTVSGTAALERWQHSYVGETHIYDESTPEYEEAISAGIYPIRSGDARYVVTGQTVSEEPATVETTIIPILSGIWLSGVILMFSYFLFSYLHVKKQVKGSRWNGEYYISEKIRSPFVFGIIGPLIYLPSDLEKNQIPLILAHEHVHIMRYDFLWKPMAFLLLSVYWFNPILWVAYILFNRDIEAACDEMVVRNMSDSGRADYSRALLSCAVKEKWISACPVAFSENSISTRIKGILNYKKPAFVMCVAAVLFIVLLSIGFLTRYSEMPGFSLRTYSYERISRTDRFSIENIDMVAVKWYDNEGNVQHSYTENLSDKDSEELLNLLSTLRFRSNYRSLIPWRINQYSDNGITETAEIVLYLSDNHYCSLWISTSGLVEVDTEEYYKTGMIFYNLTNRNAAKTIVDFLKDKISEQKNG